MKTTTLVIAILLVSMDLFSQVERLEVKIENVKDGEGNVRVALFNSEKTFTKEPWKVKQVEASSGLVTVGFENIPSGQYAIAVYHDANENGKLDYNLVGIPKEGFGFTRNAMGTFGPPSFEKASVPLSESGSLTIRMKYF